MTEPLTVEELERMTQEIIAITRNYGTWTDAQHAKSSELIREKLQSHSRQLWLEAAEREKAIALLVKTLAIYQRDAKPEWRLPVNIMRMVQDVQDRLV